MIVVIDANGMLNIKRANNFTVCDCPFNKDNRPCGDWCVLFSEPTPAPANFNSKMRIQIVLCHKTIFCSIGDFKDERFNDEC